MSVEIAFLGGGGGIQMGGEVKLGGESHPLSYEGKETITRVRQCREGGALKGKLGCGGGGNRDDW